MNPIEILTNIKEKLETEISEFKTVEISNGVASEEFVESHLQYSPFALLIWTHEDGNASVTKTVILESEIEIQIYVHKAPYYSKNLSKCYDLHDKVIKTLDGYNILGVGNLNFVYSNINRPLVAEGASVALRFKLFRKII